MPVLQQKPVTPSGRFYLKNKVDLAKKRPEKSLTKGHHRKKVETLMEELHLDVGVEGISDCTEQLTSEGIDLEIWLRSHPLNMIQIAQPILPLFNMAMDEKSYILCPEGFECG